MKMSTAKPLLVAALLLTSALATSAQQPARAPLDCASLTSLTFEGNTSITSSTLVTSGTGALILTAANTYIGGTTISSGTLQLGNGGTSGSIVGNVLDNSVLAFKRSDAVTFSGTITGSGSV